MTAIPVSLAVEDELSEYVVRTMLNHANRGYAIGTVFRRGGFGHLRIRAREFNRAARGLPYLMLTDLDDSPCASFLIDEWLGKNETKHPNFLLRVAVREVEAWLLADRSNLARFLAAPEKLFPTQGVELLRDPKKTLVEIAARSKSYETRARIVPKRGSTAKQGPDYNACLGDFVLRQWNIERAAQESESLERTMNRLQTFRPTWGE